MRSLETKRFSHTVKGFSLTPKRAVTQKVAPQRLGRFLKLARVSAGLSQGEVADALDVHEMTISAWERDRQKPSEDAIAQLARLYNTSPRALRYGTSSADSPTTVREPSVSFGLPARSRVWIQAFLLELTKADVSEREVDEARRVLTNPDFARFFSGGEPTDETEAQLLEGLEGYGAAIKNTLRTRGYSIPK